MKVVLGRAIVIERGDYKDADIKALLSTDGSGHIKIIAPNGKKSRRRFVGGVNLFSLIEYSAEKKGDVYILNESTLIDENEVAFRSIKGFIYASAIVEIATRLFTINNPDETAFYRLFPALKDVSDERGLYTLYKFLRSSMIDVGEIPELRHCVLCQKEVSDKVVLFNYYKGGVLCGRCRREDPRGEIISQSLYNLMLLDDRALDAYPATSVRQALFVLERYLRFTLNVSFSSFYFL